MKKILLIALSLFAANTASAKYKKNFPSKAQIVVYYDFQRVASESAKLIAKRNAIVNQHKPLLDAIKPLQGELRELSESISEIGPDKEEAKELIKEFQEKQKEFSDLQETIQRKTSEAQSELEGEFSRLILKAAKTLIEENDNEITAVISVTNNNSYIEDIYDVTYDLIKLIDNPESK